MINYEFIVVLALTWGAFAHLWSGILTQPGEMFDWWAELWSGTALEKPLFSCSICVAGFWLHMAMAVSCFVDASLALNFLIAGIFSMLFVKLLNRYA